MSVGRIAGKSKGPYDLAEVKENLKTYSGRKHVTPASVD
jgi:hypothetical protein